MRQFDKLHVYLKELEGADTSDDVLFQTLLITGMSLLCYSDKDIAELFAINKSSVDKWKEGKNLPHAELRRNMYNRIARFVLIEMAIVSSREWETTMNNSKKKSDTITISYDMYAELMEAHKEWNKWVESVGAIEHDNIGQVIIYTGRKSNGNPI